jgi:hypothetical protein
LIAIAIAISRRHQFTAASVNGAWTVANPTSVNRTNAVIHTVTNAIAINVCQAVATTHSQSIKLIATAITISGRHRLTTTVINRAWTIANATSVKRTNTVIYAVANAIAVNVTDTVAATHAEGVKHVPVAVAVSLWDVRASTGVDLSRSIANVTFIQCTYAIVLVVTNAIVVNVYGTYASAEPNSIWINA